MIRIFHANRLEGLLPELIGQLVRDTPDNPLAVREVVIPSLAMKRFIELEVARLTGVCLQIRFSFLAAWQWQLMSRHVAVPARSPLGRLPLAWRIYDLLPGIVHPSLRAYLRQADAAMRWELAENVAILMDQYSSYRRDWLEQWLRGESITDSAEEAWQAELWRLIANALTLTPASRLEDAFFAKIKREAPPDLGRVHIFCLPGIPPFHLDFLRRLGAKIDIALYVLNPCREYWLDLVSSRRMAALEASEKRYFETGHRLLTSWGRQAQSHLDLLARHLGQAETEERFLAADGDSLLARLQNDILDNRPSGDSSFDLSGDDKSIEIHACHALSRQIDVLHDWLLARFDIDPSLQAGDVLVLTPDLAAAAPLIDAVFSAAPEGRHLPWRISGQLAATANPVLALLLELLDIGERRITASEILELLARPLLGRRFGIDTASLALSRELMDEAHIRWGFDAGHRRDLDLPPGREGTWEQGFSRLLLGYALGDDAGLFAGLAPVESCTAGRAAVAANLRHFIERLRRLAMELKQGRDSNQWRTLLLGLIDGMFTAESSEEQMQLAEARDAATALCDAMADAEGTETVPTMALRAALNTAAAASGGKGAVPSGAITFSSLESFRHLPYPVICLVGLDDGVFPRADHPREFDLMARKPRPGDRQRATDDRGLFLDILLAARERLCIFYTGRDARDNSSRPPATPVADLIDEISGIVHPLPGEDRSSRERRVRRQLLAEHPLQPFSPANFIAPRTSYAAEFLPGGEEAARGRVFFSTEQRIAATPLPVLPLHRLQSFFANPAKAFLREALQLSFPVEEADPIDSEPLVFPDGFAERALLQAMVAADLGDGDAHGRLAWLETASERPAGAIGQAWLDRTRARAAGFASRVRQFGDIAEIDVRDEELSLSIDDQPRRLAVRIGGATLQYDPSPWRSGDLTTLLWHWPAHLAACALGEARPFALVLPDRTLSLKALAPEAAKEILAQLLRLYDEGHCRPLPFFPATSLAWFSSFPDKNPEAAARKAWEKERREAQLLFQGRDPISEKDFPLLAQAVFGPLSAHAA